MSGIVAQNDIYDNNGVLLLRKGQKLTYRTINRLKEYNRFKSIETITPDDKQGILLTSVTKEFGIRKKIRDQRILEKPNKVLNTLLFQSKTKPWWIYINALCNYMDWLYTHSIDVAMISLMIAVELKYCEEELLNIGLGALLHDIGKLLVPKSIVQKSEDLTDMEKTYIAQHCELGMSSLEGFNLPKEIKDIVMQHHERFDGSGYPLGLKGNDINLNAQIVIVADVVDKMTSFRPDRQPYNMDDAIKKLRNEVEKYPQEVILLLEKILK